MKTINKKELLIGLLIIGGYLIIPSFLFIPLKPLVDKGILTELSVNLVLLLILAIILVIIFPKDLFKDLKDFKKNYKEILKTTFKYWIIGLIIMYVSSILIELFGLAPNVNQEANIRLLKESPILEFIMALLLAPFVEELVFRKSLIKAINNKHLFAIVTGLLFAFIHVTSSLDAGMKMLFYLIPYGSIGIAFGYAYHKTKNIFGTMAIHSLHNLISLLLLILL